MPLPIPVLIPIPIPIPFPIPIFIPIPIFFLFPLPSPFSFFIPILIPTPFYVLTPHPFRIPIPPGPPFPTAIPIIPHFLPPIPHSPVPLPHGYLFPVLPALPIRIHCFIPIPILVPNGSRPSKGESSGGQQRTVGIGRNSAQEERGTVEVGSKSEGPIASSGRIQRKGGARHSGGGKQKRRAHCVIGRWGRTVNIRRDTARGLPPTPSLIKVWTLPGQVMAAKKKENKSEKLRMNLSGS